MPSIMLPAHFASADLLIDIVIILLTLTVDLASMSDLDHQDNKRFLLYLVDHPVFADTDPESVLGPF